MAGQTAGMVLDNRIIDNQTLHLAKYLNQEDICSLNNADILEEVLRNVENSVLGYNYHAKKIISAFTSVSSAFYSLFSAVKNLLYDCYKKLKNAAILVSNPGKTMLRLRIATVMPAFIILAAAFSPYGTFTKGTEKSIIVKSVVAPINPAKPIVIESQAKSATVQTESVTEKNIPTVVSNEIAKESINKSAPVTSGTTAGSPPETKIAAVPSSNPVNKSIKAEAPKTAQKKSVPKKENNISRSDQQRIELSDILKSSKKKLSLKATAYDLSMKSCGKAPSHPAYGITHSGAKASAGRTIAVDPSVIPLKSKVFISFPEAYKDLNGIYIAEDTGSLIKGYKIDVFFGEDKPGQLTINSKAKKFGVQNVDVYILE